MFSTISGLAWQQHGVFSTSQAEAAGVSRSWLSRHAESGTIVRLRPGIYAMAAAPAGRSRSLMAHILAAGPGALATADSALALWCQELDPPRRPVIAAPRDTGYRTRSARIIRSVDLELALPTERDNIPTVGVTRALLDSAIWCSADDLVTRINAVQRHSSLPMGALIDTLERHAKRGRPGITTFRSAVSMLTDEVPDSEFERLVLRDIARFGIRPPVLHHVVRLPGEDPIELDLAWIDVAFDLELDGRDHLARTATARRDRQRDRILQRHGYRVARYLWADYVENRTAMLREIEDFVTTTSSA